MAELPHVLEDYVMECALEEDSNFSYDDFPPNCSFESSSSSIFPRSSINTTIDEEEPMMDEESPLLG